MSWDFDRSKERITTHLEGMGQIEIEKLVRDADLNSLLSETNCREIFGAHAYVDVPNFARLATDIAAEEYTHVIQAVHLYQREVARLVEDENVFDGVRVHFQGPKLHALFYRPVDAAEELAAKAVLLQLVLRQFVRTTFNPAFPALENIAISGGADIGNAIGTQDGMKGDRELLFLGAPANYAAQIITEGGQLRVTPRVYDELPNALKRICTKAKENNYIIGDVSEGTLQDLLHEMGISWDPTASAERLEEDRRKFPLKDIQYSDADDLIDLGTLGIANSKRVKAASLFADVSGFTRYIDAAADNPAKKSALRVLHAIRKEMAVVVRQDFEGVRIQFQGDRVQALFHLPKNDSAAIAERAFNAAVGLQSSMAYSLKKCLPEAEQLQLAVGVDLGVTLVSKLGTRGQRDHICIGTGVQRAAAGQESCTGGETGLTIATYDLLPDDYKKSLTFDDKRSLYIASGLTFDKLERRARAAVYAAGGPVFVQSAKTGVRITREENTGARQVSPAKSYAE